MSLNVHSPQNAAHDARRVLCLNSSCRPSDSRFEILRATVWSMVAPAGTVHVNRVLGAALPAWRLLSERADDGSDETRRTELREALSTLQDAGDLLELSGGYWAPATPRFVSLSHDAGYLLIGGVPTALLPIERDTLQHHGPHRRFAVLPAEVAAALPLEDLASWAKVPSRSLSLQAWAQDVIDSLVRNPYTPTNSDAFEFYSPDTARPGAPQFRRWSESLGSASATLLARRRRLAATIVCHADETP